MDLVPIDQKLISVYGDTIQQSGRLYLYDWLDVDEEQQQIFKHVCLYNHLMYKPPSAAVRKSFVSLLAHKCKEF